MYSFDEHFERLEEERSGQHARSPRSETPTGRPGIQRPQPAAAGCRARRPVRRAGGPGQARAPVDRRPAPRAGGGLGAAMPSASGCWCCC